MVSKNFQQNQRDLIVNGSRGTVCLIQDIKDESSELKDYFLTDGVKETHQSLGLQYRMQANTT